MKIRTLITQREYYGMDAIKLRAGMTRLLTRVTGLAPDAAATAGANGVNEPALRAGVVQLDDARARGLTVQTLGEYPRTPSLDAARIDVAGNRITVTLRDHLVNIFRLVIKELRQIKAEEKRPSARGYRQTMWTVSRTSLKEICVPAHRVHRRT